MREKKRCKYDNDKKEVFPFQKYQYEFNKFLNTNGYNNYNVKNFWLFFEKLLVLKGKNNTDVDCHQQSCISSGFYKKTSKLFDTFPTTDRQGVRIKISYEDFKYFINSVNMHRDFKLKQKFNKLKAIRAAQKKLPITQYRKQILESLRSHQVILIAGDTGCGKSTQVPQYVYEAGYIKTVCTQPRRIACISLSKRVAYETLTENKLTVGYQIRFEKSKNAGTHIIFMTEGLLLRQISEAELFYSYDVIILDEIHERHLYGDFLIGIMKCLLQKRDNFKLILMSATINIKLFSEYFAEDNIDIIQVPGRLYPIDIHYRPIKQDIFDKKTKKFNSSPYLQIIQMIDQQYKPHQKGDVLIFLNGVAEITSLADVISEYSEIKKNWIVLPLHSTLSIAEQDKVFDYSPEGIRKCIISTNIAETSVTIDGIRFVVDSGKVNRMSYENQMGINQLIEMNISQDSARQRCGRAGRTGPGICYRLYSEEDYNAFQAFTTAEIHLVPLESLVLQMVALGLSDIARFPFLEKPNGTALENALERLKFYGALELNEEALMLTSLGEVLGKLPVDLPIGKMLVTSTVFGKVYSILTLASLLSIQNPFTNKAFQDTKCEQERRSLESNHGDTITLFNTFKGWLRVKQENPSKSAKETTRQWSKKRGIEEQRFYEVIKLVSNFKDILESVNLLDKNVDENLSSAERIIRKGELKQLRTIRYQLKTETKSEKRKLLTIQKYDVEEEEDASKNKHDIRDVEFRIKNDWNSMQQLLADISVESYKELTILKLLVTNGLYPQVAIADEHNSAKTVSESLFHTKSKQFIFLHPTSYFARNIDILNLTNDEIEVPPAGYFSRRPISNKHSILIYQSILETKKVYLMNTMRMAALQTLMLFSKDIHTNETLTKIVFDDFIMCDVPFVGEGKTLLLKAISLRKRWKSLLNDMLKGNDKKENVSDLIDSLVTYMQTKVSYNVKRLLPADIKIIYLRYSLYIDDMPKFNPFDSEYQLVCNNKYGGIQVTENVVYNCLIEEEWSINLTNELNSITLECPTCDNSILGTFLEKIIHEVTCKTIKSENADDIEKQVQSVKSNSRIYFCEKCRKDYCITATEIVKHKKRCQI